jgi:hypothetical protein
MVKFLLNIVLNNIFQGIALFILSIILLIYRIKYPSPSPDAGASDQNLSIAIMVCIALAISIFFGWMPPISL